MRFAEENTKPGQTRAEALMSIASSVAKVGPRTAACLPCLSAFSALAFSCCAARSWISHSRPPHRPSKRNALRRSAASRDDACAVAVPRRPSAVPQDAPPSVKRSDLLMELAETVSREARTDNTHRTLRPAYSLSLSVWLPAATDDCVSCLRCPVAAPKIPPSPNRAQLLMQLFMAAEEAPTPYRA